MSRRTQLVHRSLVPGATILMLLSMSACSGAGGDPTQDEPSITVRSITSSSEIKLPVARYANSAADDRAFFTAVNVAQKECAAKYGAQTTIPVTVQPTQMDLDSVRRYGLVNSDEVERYGYKPSPGSADQVDDKSNGWNPSAREAEVMQGQTAVGQPSNLKADDGTPLPKGGCGAEGFRKLWGEKKPPQGTEVVENILTESWALTMADSRALAASKKWAECMSKHGYDFEHRWDAGNSVGTAPQETQIEMAKRDLECAISTDYVGNWYAVDASYQERLIEKNQGQLDAGLEQHRQIMKRAQKILQAGR